MEASSSSCGGIYHVLLSFRAEEIGQKFADHLYTALNAAGFRTYRGDKDLEMGEEMESQVQKAIQESRMSIVVFSQGYASSVRCLDELVMILERKRTCPSHHLLPVFYDADPSDVRKQLGRFEDAFRRHEETSQVKDKVEAWRKALKEAADLAGMNLQNQADGHECKFIQKIIEVIQGRLSHRSLDVALHPVGLERRVFELNIWLADESIDVGILAICGMGGIGKTTIAKYIYNSNFSRFEGSSFLASIAQVSKQQTGLISIQEQLLSDILKGRDERINNVHEGIVKIKDALHCKRVLLVLDDVDTRDQMGATLGICDWLGPGSRVIITTRDEQLVKRYKACKVYGVELLDKNESLELFSWHAFGQNHPTEEYEEISERVVDHCGSLPLAIEVLGSSLSGRTIDVWESQLEKLRKIPNDEILAILKTSYDTLDDHDQTIFLHIACFFVGYDKNHVVQILDGCNLHTKVGLQNLIDRYLLKCDFSTLKMHQLIQEMGREIVRQESPEELGKRSRLWEYKDSLSVIMEKTGTEKIEALFLSMDKSTTSSRSNRKRHFQKMFPSNLSTLWPFTGTSARNSNDQDLETKAFENMRSLKLLQLNNVHLRGSYEKFPKKLKWLCWQGFPLQAIPNDFHLEELVILEMAGSSLKHVWIGTKDLMFLKILNLSNSNSLTKTPDFSLVTSLERLMLENCTSLVEIHESIGKLEKLDMLSLKNCKSLRKLPRSIGSLKSLRTLDISDCSNLARLATEEGNMTSITAPHAYGIGQVKAHSWLPWNWNSKRKKSLEFSWASFPSFLVRLSLENCNLSDETFPADLKNLNSLRELDLSRNPICSLPDCIKGLSKLEILNLTGCPRLHSITGLQELRQLVVIGCELLENIHVQSLPASDLDVHIAGCKNLDEIKGRYKLEPLTNMGQEIIANMGLSNFRFFGETNVPLNETRSLTFRHHGKKYSTLQVCHCYYFFKHTREDNSHFSFLKMMQFQEPRVFRTYIWGDEVPAWFNFKSRGRSISFTVPANFYFGIQGLTVCFVYVPFPELDYGPTTNKLEFNVCVNNKTKGVRWSDEAITIGMPERVECKCIKEITLLDYWKLEGHEITAGDELEVSILLCEETFKAREIGVRLLYREQENESEELKTTEVDDLFNYHLRLHLEESKLKLIMNACPRDNSGDGMWGYGGVIRDERGRWMVGYYGYFSLGRSYWQNYDDDAIFYTKIKNICEGLKVIYQRGWTQVEVEIDSLDLLHFLQAGDNIHYKSHRLELTEFYRLLDLTRFLLQRCECTLSHTPLNHWNDVADKLASQDRPWDFQTFHVLEDPPVELGLVCLVEKRRIKLNTSGTSHGKLRKAGFGGVFTDNNSACIKEYNGRLIDCIRLKAELHAIHRGLLIIYQNHIDDFYQVTIETDCKAAIDILQTGFAPSNHLHRLVMESKHMVKSCKCNLMYIPREKNSRAYALANLGMDQEEPYQEPPVQLYLPKL